MDRRKERRRHEEIDERNEAREALSNWKRAIEREGVAKSPLKRKTSFTGQ